MSSNIYNTIMNIVHAGHSYNSVIQALERLQAVYGNNEETLIDALYEYYYGE